MKQAEDDDVGGLERDMKLANAGNHDAMYRIGSYHFQGDHGLQQDKEEGMKWWRRAAEAGNAEAAHNLGVCYEEGDGVDQDCDRALEYFQKAADGGIIQAFVGISRLFLRKYAMQEAVLNMRKAVICGWSDKDMFNSLKQCYRGGYITKEEYAFTLRENQKASNEMKSESREKANEMFPHGFPSRND